MTPQYFKGDATEIKMDAAATAIFDTIATQLDLFYTDAYIAASFGDIIYAAARAPLSNAILQTIFRDAFNDIFTAFISAGTFESYLNVFRKVFGTSVVVSFTVPSPGKLNIVITADDLILVDFIEREIVAGAYVYYNVTDFSGNQIIFQSVQGFQSQYQLNQMLFELVPDGISTNITLNIGG